MGSELLESLRCPDLKMTVQTFRNCLDEARLTLLFLRNISRIDFCIRHDANFNWRVSRGNWPEGGTFSDWANVKVERCNSQHKVIRTTERWWRVIVDVLDAPADLQYRHKRRMKYVECGIAALVATVEEATGPSLNCLKSRFFNCVPLKFESTLPVQVHATFLLSGDRQNIAIEETSQDAGSEWNRWLLNMKIPQVYLQFLEDLGRKIGLDIYDYFPIGPNERQQSLSDLVRTAFWEEVKSSHHRLFPVVETVEINDKRHNAMEPNRRQAPKLVEPRHAVFDLLDKQRSHAFRPLLSHCSENLVCPPSRLIKHVRTVPGFIFVTPSLIRRVLQSDKAVQYVESMMRTKSNSFSTLLSFIIPVTDDDFVELDGCTILPLMDGSLGTLSLRPGNAEATNNHAIFSANTECRRLFSFASSHFSQDKGNENFVRKILDSGRLNLKRFGKCHVDVMLKCKKSWAVDSTLKTWLFDFWDYMNSTSQFVEQSIKSEPLDLESLQHFPLLLCHRGGTETLKSLQYFRNDPAVLSPDVEIHRDLYAEFSELDIVDSRTIPESYRGAEKSLLDLNSMNRFLRSVEIMAKRSAQSVTEFVRSRLKERNVEVGWPSILILLKRAEMCEDFTSHRHEFLARSCSLADQRCKRSSCVAAYLV